MANDNIVSILYDQNGNPVAVQNGSAISGSQSIVPISGSDGTNNHIIKTDGYGNVEVVTPVGKPLEVSGSFEFTPALPGTSVTTSVAGSITSVTLLASNVNRLGATIYNDISAGFVYIKFGTTASSTDFTIKLYPMGYFEVPFGYTGRIDAISSSATGSFRITELSA